MSFEEFTPKELLHIPRIQRRGMRSKIRHVVGQYARLNGPKEATLWAEFGVATGKTVPHWIPNVRACGTDHTLDLFDIFTGLPEEWDRGDRIVPKGKFRAPVIPSYREEFVHVHVGMFADTAPPASWNGKLLRFVYIDSDIYSGSLDALYAISEYIIPGTVILFDDLYDYPNYLDHQYKALCQWRDETKWNVEWKWRSKESAGGVIV